MARSGRPGMSAVPSLSEGKQTWRGHRVSVAIDPQRSSLEQPLTGAQNVDVLIRLGDEHATGDTAVAVGCLS